MKMNKKVGREGRVKVDNLTFTPSRPIRPSQGVKVEWKSGGSREGLAPTRTPGCRNVPLVDLGAPGHSSLIQNAIRLKS